MKVEKAIITAAGYGTRFLPATKNIPKEMLPLVDVPIIHELAKECIESGIKQIIIVTRYGGSAIEDYFDNNKELEDHLSKVGQSDRYKRFKEVFNKADFAYVRQNKSMPYGNGCPAIAAKPFLQDGEPFAYMFGDDVILARNPGIGQLKKKFENLSAKDASLGGVIGVTSVDRSEISKYASVQIRDKEKGTLKRLIEKPDPSEAPTLLASYGRYIVSDKIFDYLTPEAQGKNGEVWFADAVDKLAGTTNVYYHEIDGKWITTGDPLQLLQASIDFALQRKDLRESLLKYMKEALARTK